MAIYNGFALPAFVVVPQEQTNLAFVYEALGYLTETLPEHRGFLQSAFNYLLLEGRPPHPGEIYNLQDLCFEFQIQLGFTSFSFQFNSQGIIYLDAFFGDNAIQDIDKLIIQKADLPGITPTGNNTAQSLLVALLLHALDRAADSNPSIQLGMFNPYLRDGKFIDQLVIHIYSPIEVVEGKVNLSNYIKPSDF